MKNFIKKITNIFMKPEMMILPGELAFFLILAIFPLLTIITYVGSNIDLFNSAFIGTIEGMLPEETTKTLIPFIIDGKITGNVAIFLIIGFYLISNGTNAIIITSNELYNIENSSFLKRRIKAFFMIILLVSLFIFTILVLAYGNIIAKYIINLKIFSSITSQLYTIFVLFKWPISFICIFWMVKLLYSLAPDTQIPSKYMNKGSLITTLGWIIVTSFYSYYISHFANYEMFYGSISSIIVMMIWIYLISYIFVLGIAINASEYEDKHKKKKIG